jgi:RNA polymerase sigma-70 factor (ECF subfamily)
LLAAAAAGEGSAFRVLLARHGGRVHACALRMTNDGQAAQEIVHDVFLAMLREAAAFRFEASLATWLYRVALNRCRDLARKNSRRVLPVALDTVEADVMDEAPGPLEAVVTSERAARLDAVLAELPGEMREVIALRFAAGLSYDDIAETLGCPTGSVASRLHRALRRVGERLEALGLTPETL